MFKFLNHLFQQLTEEEEEEHPNPNLNKIKINQHFQFQINNIYTNYSIYKKIIKFQTIKNQNQPLEAAVTNVVGTLTDE